MLMILSRKDYFFYFTKSEKKSIKLLIKQITKRLDNK